MKILYLNCSGGAAGDMLTAAIAALLADKDGFFERLNSVGLPGVRVESVSPERCGIIGSGTRVTVNGISEEEAPPHHGGHHHHSSLTDIEDVINGLKVSQRVKADSMAVYRLIAEAEAAAHGKPAGEVHFHEVGAMDAVTDVVGFSMAIEELSPDKIVVSPLRLGKGSIKCAHGVLPVPAPATARILTGVPVFSGDVDGEFCTPTGAALLKHFADSFGDFPSGFKAEAVGFGMGKRHFYDTDGSEFLSMVTAQFGNGEGSGDEICELLCSVDDMTAEEAAFAAEILLEEGAREVYLTPVIMKKGRPGLELTCLCGRADRNRFADLIFKHTSTIGIREFAGSRYVLSRRTETVSTELGEIRVKISEGGGHKKAKAEYDDLAKIAREKNMSLRDVREKAGL